MNVQKVADHITDWLREYAEKARVEGFVIGVSGGVDSAVTSTLCARTGLPVLCLEMPIHQAMSQVTRANEHIDQLKKRYPNVRSQRVDLTQTFETFVASCPDSDETDRRNLSLANTRARLRMTTLYYFAGLEGLLVAGTGNKVEDFGVGFYTKYGDGGVDLSPIADLVKSEVFALAEYLEVPESIRVAKPTDGLFGDSRTDEDQLGANYDELEWAMTQQDAGKTPEAFSGRDREVMQIYLKLNRSNRHKMEPIPVCEISDEIKSHD